MRETPAIRLYFRVQARHDAHKGERRGWIVEIVTQDGDVEQVVARNLREADARAMLPAVALAMETGVRAYRDVMLSGHHHCEVVR